MNETTPLCLPVKNNRLFTVEKLLTICKLYAIVEQSYSTRGKRRE